MNEKKQDIVLLNDGEKTNQEGHCNSWPTVGAYETNYIKYPTYCTA